MRPEEATAGSLRTLTIEYEQATLAQLDHESVTVGADCGTDAAGATVNEALPGRLTNLSVSEPESQLTLQFDGSASIGVRDELVVQYTGAELSADT
ncbi:hypothetical protein Nmn1133_10835 [Halosegnis longus]|uniref:Uncharacterized protein n=1 Tax=Halosegnis longus TaxID=2216012 RepID=A0AAJ4R9N6_9EURY|nr:hypothetical protein Nmn1133_10835 [Salella cibi]